MVTQAEETQARDFLKRAEIKTMKKDLLALREVDSLKERDKIAKIKTLEEQQQEEVSSAAKSKANSEKNAVERVLEMGGVQEAIAEKDLKKYATEQERQQIFLMESQRLELEKKVDAIDKEKDPALKLEKNKFLIQKRALETKLSSVVEQEKKLDTEQKFIANKAQTSTIPAEKKSLEARRWEMDKEIQDVEKNRWEVEKQMEEVDAKVRETDKLSDQNTTEKNGLRNKVLSIDKSLREIYTVVMVREEEKRSGLAEAQVAKKEALAKTRFAEKEKVQRQQWSGSAGVDSVPVPTRNKAVKSFESENEQRKKFMQDVEQGSQIAGSQQQKSNIK